VAARETISVDFAMALESLDFAGGICGYAAIMRSDATRRRLPRWHRSRCSRSFGHRRRRREPVNIGGEANGWRETIRLTAALIIAAALALAAATPALAYPHRPAWLPRIWWQIGMCETQLDWQHRAGSYQGAFGFYRGSWDRFKPAGYPSEAYEATPRQQYAVALAIYARYGFGGWGCYTHGGYRYWQAKS
jgi:hypothetical protein